MRFSYPNTLAGRILRIMIPFVIYLLAAGLAGVLLDMVSPRVIAWLWGAEYTDEYIRLQRPLLATGLAAILALPPFLRMYRQDRTDHKEAAGKRTISTLAAFCLAAAAAGAGASVILTGIMEAAGVYERFSNAVQEQLLSSAVFLRILVIVFLAPVEEELLFRGLIYGRMREWFSFSVSALLSSMLFAAGHGNMIQFLYAFPMALLLAVIREKSGSFLPAVAFHMGANLMAVAGSLSGMP